MSAAEKLIEVEGLSKSYGDVLAVRGVTFGVGRGEVVGFLGPNGAGKSTTLRMLVGYLAPSAGRVRVAGHDMAEAPLLARRSIGYMPETAPVYPELRVGEHLELRAALKGLKRRERDAAVGDAAEKAGVAEVLGTLCGELSRGYRQRVALADALLGDPPLLVLDEPTAGLDPNQIRSVRELVASLGRDHTVLLSTHILSEVETICSRVLVIDRGLLVAEGSIAELAAERGAREAELVVSGDVARARTLIEEHPEVLRVADHAEPHAAAKAESTAKLGDAAKAESTAKLGDAAKPGAAVQPRDPAQHVRLSVRFRDAARPPPLDALIAILVGAGVSVHEARPATTRLEHLFQRLTGEAA